MKVESKPAPVSAFDPILVTIRIESYAEMSALRDIFTYFAKTTSSKDVVCKVAEDILPHVTPL